MDKKVLPVAIELPDNFIANIYDIQLEKIETMHYEEPENENTMIRVYRQESRNKIAKELAGCLERYLEIEIDYTGNGFEHRYIYVTLSEENVNKMKLLILNSYGNLLKDIMLDEDEQQDFAFNIVGCWLRKRGYKYHQIKDSFMIKTLLEHIIVDDEFASEYLYTFPTEVMVYEVAQEPKENENN